MLRTSLTKKRGKTSTKEIPRTPTRPEKKANSRTNALLNNSSDKKKAKQPPTPESSESSSDSDNDGEFEVEAILGRKVNREGKVFYRIKWKGFDLRYATWEPEENVSNAPKLIENYEKTLKAEGSDDKGDRTRRQPKDLLRKRGLDELAGRKKGGAQKNTNRRKRMESEDEEEEEEDFYDEVTDEEEVEDQEGDSESEEDQEEESESEEEESDDQLDAEEPQGGRKGKKAPAVNARKGGKKLKTETVSAVPVKEISKEKKKPEPVPVVSNETQQGKRKSVGKLKIQEEPEETPAISVQQQSKEMQLEAPQEEKKDTVQEEKTTPVQIARAPMQEEIEEKQAVPSKKNSLVSEPTPVQSSETKPTAQADREVIKNMIVEEESPEKALPASLKPDTTATTFKPAASQPAKPSRDDSDHATNVLRELGRTSSAFKINLEAKSDYNNLLLSRNNSGFQQPNSAFNSSKTSAIPSQKDSSKPSATEVAPVNPNINSANPLLGLLNNKDSAAVPSALSLPFGAANPLLNNPLLYGAAGGMNRSLDDEEARKNQIVFQGYLQISNYMLPQNNPMAAMNNNRMRNMLGANPFAAAMNPLHNPFLPNSTNFPGYFGMPNPLLAANPLFPAMGMAPALPNFFGPMAGLAGAPGNNMRNNMMFSEMMKSGLSPSNLATLQGTGTSTPSGNNGKGEKNKNGNKEIIILDDKKEDGKKKEVGEKK